MDLMFINLKKLRSFIGIREEITRVWKRGQREINAWKQTLCNKRINAYLSKTFTAYPH